MSLRHIAKPIQSSKAPKPSPCPSQCLYIHTYTTRFSLQNKIFFITSYISKKTRASFLVCQSLSFKGFNDNNIDDTKMKDGTLVESEFVYEQETHLTVSKTSVFFAGDGFIVYGCKGEVVLRVDTYAQDARDSCELVLMDPHGRCLLTVRRKRPSLHQRWEGFVGERTDGQKHIFSVRRSSMIGRSTVTVEVLGDPGQEYQIEGSFLQRSCTIFDAEKKLVAEIKRKVDASTHTTLGKDVFALCVKPGFDAAFAMGLVLVLDQINADDQINVDDYGNDGVVVDPTADV